MQEDRRHAASRIVNFSVSQFFAAPAETLESGSARMEHFVTESRKAKRFFVSGMVQGVGFRFFARHHAARLGISGYVCNRMDGRVEVYAIGNENQLAEMRAAIERGPSGASVDHVAEEPAGMDPRHESEFSITYDH